jgi:hypothetical protein
LPWIHARLAVEAGLHWNDKNKVVIFDKMQQLKVEKMIICNRNPPSPFILPVACLSADRADRATDGYSFS